MVVNIFGVGRSGTKSLQLFIAYALLQQHERIRLNYEPYFWATRLLGVKSFNGIKHHLTTKHFTNSLSDFNLGHQDYLKNISKGNVVVNKFIRANGRIGPIAEITNADYNILIVRKKNDVLKSVNKERFDFTSIGAKFRIDYKQKFMNDAQSVGLDFEESATANEMVWQAYNDYAMQQSNIILVDYDRLLDAAYVAKQLSFLKCEPGIFKKYENLRGNQIHKNEILQNDRKISKNTLLDKIKFYSVFRLNYSTSFSEQIVGDEVSLNSNFKI